MDANRIAVLICTYNRPLEIRMTVQALQYRLRYSGKRFKVDWIVCDDSSPDGYVESLTKDPLFAGFHFVSTPHRSGWGTNVNNGLQYIESMPGGDGAPEFVYFTEDDYVLREHLDLDLAWSVMQAMPALGMLRFRGTAGSRLIYHQTEVDITRYMPKYVVGQGVSGKATLLLIDGGSPELWLYSNGPHLKRAVLFHGFYGYYPSGLKLGETEERYCHIVKNQMKIPGAPQIGIMPEWIFMHYDHIGKSHQLGELDARL